MQLFSADATMFLKSPQKVEKNTLKCCSEILKFFSPIAVQMAQTEEQNRKIFIFPTGLEVHFEDMFWV